MKIFIATIGTRGDVQPYIALGRALMEVGHDITICTCAHFEPFVREYGLGYAYVNNDFIAAIVTGFWFLNQADDWNPSRSLTEFLSRGETPVYFGFGSIFGRDPKRVTQIMLAGKPSIICPFFGDQPFWGRHVERLRVGPSPIPQKKLTVESLCHAIDTVMNDSTMRENAAVLGRSLRKENGTSNAVAFITQWSLFTSYQYTASSSLSNHRR